MMSNVLEYKKIQIRNKELFKGSCKLMEEEGFEVHQTPTFIAFVQKKPDSSGLRPKIVFSAKEDEPIRGYMGANDYYPVIFDANVENIIDDIAESLGIGSIQSDEYESNIVEDKEDEEDNSFESNDAMKNNNYLNDYLNDDFSEALDIARESNLETEIDEIEKETVAEAKEAKENNNESNNKNNNENKWIPINVKLPSEEEMVEIAYSYDIYNRDSPYVKPVSKIGYKFAFLKNGEWHEESENYVGKFNSLDGYNILAWKRHIPYCLQTIKGFLDKSKGTNKDYDFVCIKNSKSTVLGTMVVKNGCPVVQTTKSRNSFSLDDIVLSFEEWFQKDVGIDNGLTITIMG